MTAKAGLTRQGLRFSVVGALNSVVGYGVIMAALLLGASDYLANALGYAVGLGIGFLLHRNWVFAGPDRAIWSSGSRYMIAFAIAYLVNIAVVASARQFGLIDNPITHIAAMACYSVSFFLLSRYFVFSPENENGRVKSGRLRVAGLLSAAGVVLCAAIYFAVVLTNPTTHDVVWQLWIGDRLHGGSRLYIDIMELNPPLWFWMSQGVAAIGDVVMLESRTVLIAMIILWSVMATRFVFRLLPGVSGVGIFVAILCAIVATYSFRYFGQREHLALLAAIPYAILIARRRSGASVGVGLAVMVALPAAPVSR